MKNSYTIEQIREIGQDVKKVNYTEGLGKWTLGYGKWVPRLFSPYITWFLLKLFPGITPNMVSYLMLVTCIGALILLLKGFFIWGGIVIYFSIVLDKVDGEVARMKNLYSFRGVFLDYQYHFVYCLCLLCTVLNIYKPGENLYILLVGIFGSLLMINQRYMTISNQKILYKTKNVGNQTPPIDFSNIKPKILRKIIGFFGLLCRQDLVAVFIVLFAIASYWYTDALTVFLLFYFPVLVIYVLVLFSASFQEKRSPS
jgi:phosphatidylglycerophosphate synthase